jgi:NAD(P)-dependent dehydrogenase (short-subunit alcohol dehydrogenase family)
MGRWSDPDEIGALAVYLASDASKFMTGSIVKIDGGLTLSANKNLE